MYNNILIPIDMAHPEKADDMIAAGVKLANEDAPFLLLSAVHSIPAYAPVDLTSEYFERAQNEAKAELSKIAGKNDLNAEIKVCVGDAHHSILETAEEYSAQLVIVGSHRPGFSDYLLGSTAARVVRVQPNIPVRLGSKACTMPGFGIEAGTSVQEL